GKKKKAFGHDRRKSPHHTVLNSPPHPHPHLRHAHIRYFGNTDEFDMLSSPAGSDSDSGTRRGCYCWDSGAMFCLGEKNEGEGEGEGKGGEGEGVECSHDAAEEGFYYS